MLIPIRDHNPTLQRPYVTYLLMVVNIGIFISYAPLFAQERLLMQFFMEWGMVPARLSAGEGWSSLLTHQFLHGGWLHLGSNMLFLWIFGNNMEEVLGRWKFLIFYLLCGVAAGGAQYLAEPASFIPMVGASGAVAGVLGGYLLFYPRARIDLFLFLIILFRIIPAPAWVVLGGWFALQLLGGLSTPADVGGIAYWAHAGGFLAGVALCLPLWLRLGGTAFWARCLGHPPHAEARYPIAGTDLAELGKYHPSPWKKRRNPWKR